ncbi:hypothetical protein FBY35_3970 [Streptomyces sp. SLBN-118]|nr:hypothetical protein FBY35_3970 [Streptomyces sp. SLBN-118]
MQHVTCTGTALAMALLPLVVVGALLAKALATDPMTPVNAMITSGGHRARISPSEWRRCRRSAAGALRRWKAAERR